MTFEAFGKQREGRRRGALAAILAGLLTLAAAGPAQANFTCSSNADCAATAAGCLVAGADPVRCGHECADGVCAPNDPKADNIGCILVPNDSKCDDGDFCNGDEFCTIAKGCQDGTPPTCDDQIPCTLDSCSTRAGQCEHAPRNSVCSDGQFCNGAEICDAVDGCRSGTPPKCGDSVSCTVDSCDEVNDTCRNTPNNALCSDGKFCDGVETCDAVKGCQEAPKAACDDGFACTADTCNEANDTCGHTANNALCDNGAYCDGAETCSLSKGCQSGTPVNCGDGVACTTDTCVEATDSCSNTPNNAACSDGQFCNGVETCDATKGCQAGTPPNCADKFSCTTDSCNEQTDSCNNVPVDALCSDGQFCDGAEVCSPTKGCQPGTPPCNDGFSCTVDFCSESTDKCGHTPYDSLCADGKFCNGDETCDVNAGCKPGTPVNCADDVACTVDTCIESTDTCAHSPSNALCSDGLFCNGKETCDVLIGCHAGLAPACSDNVDCTVDTCIEETDSCDHVASDALCSDGKFCDGAETCDPAAGCQAGAPPDCIDDIDCTVDSCSETSKSCVNAPDNSACSNELFCDGSEVCNPTAGCQAGTAPNCGDALTCTTDSCSEAWDMCLYIPNFSQCGNGTVEPACGEECDSDNGEICNNDLDDDNDMLIDCADPDCADKVEPTCDATCQLVPPCKVLLRDPAVIRYDTGTGTRSTTPPGLFSFHARLMPETPVDPGVDGFLVTLANANGVIFRANVKAVEIQSSMRRWAYQAPDPAKVAREGGVLRLSVVRRTFGTEVGYGFRVKVYGDFTAATVPRMTTQVYFGDDVGYVTAEWTGEPGHWVLRQRDYEGGR